MLTHSTRRNPRDLLLIRLSYQIRIKALTRITRLSLRTSTPSSPVPKFSLAPEVASSRCQTGRRRRATTQARRGRGVAREPAKCAQDRGSGCRYSGSSSEGREQIENPRNTVRNLLLSCMRYIVRYSPSRRLDQYHLSFSDSPLSSLPNFGLQCVLPTKRCVLTWISLHAHRRTMSFLRKTIVYLASNGGSVTAFGQKPYLAVARHLNRIPGV